MALPTLIGASRGLVIASSAYLVNALVGTWLAISHDIPGRPLGIQTGLPVALDFIFGLGTGLSAPLAMLIALAVLTVLVARQESGRTVFWIGFLGGCFLVGMLIEPILGEAIRGELGLLLTGVIVVNVLLPILIIALAIRIARRTTRHPTHARAELSSG